MGAGPGGRRPYGAPSVVHEEEIIMLSKIWWRLEWAFWKKFFPLRLSVKLRYYLALLIQKKKGKRAFEYWLWSMTPYPAGMPFLSQYIKGILLAFSDEKGEKEIIRKNEEDVDRMMDEIRSRLGKKRGFL